MTPALAAIRPGGKLYRVGRAPDAWAWPDWAYAGEDGTFGNRYDDPAGEYRVLYACSQRAGAFVETLARYRVDPLVTAAYAEIVVDAEDNDAFPTITPGIVPREWRATRRIGTARHTGPFAEVGHSSSIAHVRLALADHLAQYQLDDLDGGDLRRRAPRELTQQISRYVFEHDVLEDGESLAGVRYLSRLGDNFENWAIFEPSEPYDTASDEISADDEDLLTALRIHDLILAA